MKNKKSLLMTVMFTGIIAVIFIANSILLLDLVKKEIRAVIKPEYHHELMMPNEIEAVYNSNFYERMGYIDINGFARRILGQKIVNGAIKDKNGYLNLVDNTEYKFDVKKEKDKSDKAIQILEYAKESGADILYVQRPWKNSDESEEVLPYGITLEYGLQFNYWCERMEEENVPVLDLREALNEHELKFYKTDHHWTIRTSLYAAGKIINTLNDNYNLNLNEQLVDINNYDSEIFKNCFLGSQGIKTGKYYVGKDDFEVIIPKFDTSTILFRYDNEGLVEKRSGNFSDAFISYDLINDENYNNKYSSYTFDGYIENRIYNYNADNNLKVLLIADSFSRPLVTFFSQCFYETRNLDPQAGRYTDSYVEYIEEYKPDVVVMMFPGDGTFENV